MPQILSVDEIEKDMIFLIAKAKGSLNVVHSCNVPKIM